MSFVFTKTNEEVSISQLSRKFNLSLSKIQDLFRKFLKAGVIKRKN